MVWLCRVCEALYASGSMGMEHMEMPNSAAVYKDRIRQGRTTAKHIKNNYIN